MNNNLVLKELLNQYEILKNEGMFVCDSHNSHLLYLKWKNELVGIIDDQYNVVLVSNNSDINNIFNHKHYLNIDEWKDFVSDRIISSHRRDIDKFLYKYELSQYNPLKISKITRCINANDQLWLSFDIEESYEDIVENVFDDVFVKDETLSGNSIYSPGGMNIKNYGFYKGDYGIFKRRISPLTTDVESEIAVYQIAKLLGIKCCPAYRIDKDTMFSKFNYDFRNEYIVHFRRLLSEPMPENITEYICRKYPQYKKDFFQMLVLDFITRQDDRHPSNYAIKVTKNKEEFYDLYDNGRSLFYEDTPEMVEDAIKNPIMYATTFGFTGTYYDHICDMLEDDESLTNVLNLDNITLKDIEMCLDKAGISGYRKQGAMKWIEKTIEIVRLKMIENNHE